MLDFGIILSAMYLLPMYIQNGLLLPVALAGIIMLPGGIINAVTSAVAGRLYDSIGVKRPAVVGAVLALIGVVMLLLTSTRTPVAFVIAAHVVLMVGCPLIMSPAQTSALNSLPGLATNDGSTILNTVQQIVGALATALATSFLELGQRAGDGSAASRFTSGVHYGFVFTLVLVVMAFILTLLIREPQREK